MEVVTERQLAQPAIAKIFTNVKANLLATLDQIELRVVLDEEQLDMLARGWDDAYQRTLQVFSDGNPERNAEQTLSWMLQTYGPRPQRPLTVQQKEARALSHEVRGFLREQNRHHNHGTPMTRQGQAMRRMSRESYEEAERRD